MSLIEPEVGPEQVPDVISWDVRAYSDFRPFYLLNGKRAGYDGALRTTVQISVEFDNDKSAAEFETMVRAMLPGYR